MSSDAIMNLVFSAYSRQDEYEADDLGLKYMDLAGYDPEGMVRTLKVIDEASKGAKIPLFLRTHPYLHDRINKIETQIALMKDRTGKPIEVK